MAGVVPPVPGFTMINGTGKTTRPPQPKQHALSCPNGRMLKSRSQLADSKPPPWRAESEPRGRCGNTRSLSGNPRASGAGGAADQADGIEGSLLARSFLLALTHLVALIEQLDLLHLLEGLAQRPFGVLKLDAQLIGGTLEIVAPVYRSLGIGWVGEMARVMNPGPVLLHLDLALKIDRHTVEFGNHALDLRNPAPLLVNLKFLQPDERLA